MNSLNREEVFLAKYEEIKSDLKIWGSYVSQHLEKQFFQLKPRISWRLKEEKSLFGKAFYRKMYDDFFTTDVQETTEKILTEITDKIGVKIVVKDMASANHVFNEIQNDVCWKSSVTRVIKDTIYEQPDTFIYTGYHIVVSPIGAGPYRLHLKKFMTCEIQVRTQLQDTYADVSHDIVYKKVFRHDVEVRRMLARVMALLEVADESFESVYCMTSDMNRNIPAYIDSLVNLYQNYSPNFNEDQIDYRVFDQSFDVLKRVPIEKLDNFLSKRSRQIKAGLSYNENRFIFKQPIILLMVYYAALEPEYFSQIGLLTSEDQKRLFDGFNISLTTY